MPCHTALLECLWRWPGESAPVCTGHLFLMSVPHVGLSGVKLFCGTEQGVVCTGSKFDTCTYMLQCPDRTA